MRAWERARTKAVLRRQHRRLFVLFTTALLCVGTSCKKTDDEDRRRKADAKVLESLSYLGSKPISRKEAEEKQGLTKLDEERVYPGIVVYASHDGDTAHFIDLEGNEVHRIHVPGFSTLVVEPYGKGTIMLGRGHMVSVSWDGTVRWKNDDFDYHHDLEVLPSGEILAPAQSVGTVEHEGETLKILDHALKRIDAQGKVVGSHRLLPLVRDLVPERILDRIADKKRRLVAEGKEFAPKENGIGDLLHVNFVRHIDGDLGVAPAGSFLVSFRNLNLLAIFDHRFENRLWHWGPGVLEKQHNPIVTDDGTIMVFDNRPSKKRSRAVEVDPRTRKIVWQSDETDVRFFTGPRGQAQPLPNGNIFVAESDNGRFLEFTQDGKVVWEYWNPDQPPAKGWHRRLLPERLLFHRGDKWWPEMRGLGEHADFVALFDKTFPNAD